MKIFYATVSIFALLISFKTGTAQSCGNSGPSACTPVDSLAKPGLETQYLPCVLGGIAYSSIVQFKMYDTINFAGTQVVDSVQFAGISNLPCGICWATNSPNNMFYANEIGCISFTGNSHDSSGQYPVEINLTAWVNGQATANNVPAELVNDAGVVLWARVESDSGIYYCAPVDTTTDTLGNQNTPNRYASCAAAIIEINNNISSLNLMPNPVSSTTTLSFNANEAVTCQLRITDVTGKMISTRALQAIPGRNTAVIERNTLCAGIYFLTLGDGKSVVTRKFVVVD